MGKKIALVSCYFQKNYGSQLQAFATQMAFDKFCLENETIKIDGIKSEISKAKYIYFLSHIFDPNTVKDKMATVRKVIAAKRNTEYAHNLSIRNNMFDIFASNKFRLSKQYNSKAEITKAANNYAAFVVGSDQLWLPSNIYANYYTLNFVPKDIVKISFATSFGVSELLPKYGKLACCFLHRLDFISVRETSGQMIIKQWAGRNVPVVCDPTMLFTADEWTKSLNAEGNGNRFSNKEKYIFVYFLGNNPWERDFVSNVRKETGLKIVQLAHIDEYIKSDEGFADYAPFNIGPKEFVELIRDAEYVFTDSFHCSVFSMLNQKFFYTFPRYSQDGSVSTNGRLYSLLSWMHQESRLLRKQDIDNLNVKDLITKQPDYDLINSEINRLRQFTWDWLKQTLTDSGIL